MPEVTEPKTAAGLPSRPAGYLWYALGVLTAVNLLSYINRNVIFALFESVERDLGFSDLDAGWIASAYVLVFSLAALPFGVFSDLRSRRAVMAGGIAVWSAFGCLAGLSQGFGSLFLTRALVGAGGAAAAAAAASIVADYFPGQRRALAMGIYMSGISLGGVMGIVLGGSMQQLYGWRVAMMAVGFPGFALALLAWRLDDPGRPPLSLKVREVLHELELGARGLIRGTAPLLVGTVTGLLMAWWLNQRYGPDSKLDTAALAAACGIGLAVNIVFWVRQARRGAGPGQPPDAIQTALDEIALAFSVVLRTPTLVYIFVGGALISFGMNGLVGWAPTLLSRSLGLSIRQISAVLGSTGLVAGVLGTLVGGWLADSLRRRYPSARVVVAGAGFLIGGPLTLWLLTIRELSLFIPVFSAAFFFLTWYSGPLTAAIFDVAPARLSATVAGAYLLFIHLAGDAVAFPLVGMLSDKFGLDRAMYLLPIMSMAGGLVVIAARGTIARDITQVSKVTGEWKVVGGGRTSGGEARL